MIEKTRRKGAFFIHHCEQEGGIRRRALGPHHKMGRCERGQAEIFATAKIERLTEFSLSELLNEVKNSGRGARALRGA